NLLFPVIGEMEMSPLNGAHTTYPLGKMTIPNFSKDKFASQRDIVMIVDEALINECQPGEARQMVWFVDATVEAKPMVVSSFSVAEASGARVAAALDHILPMRALLRFSSGSLLS